MPAPRPTPRPIKPGQGRPPDSWDGHNIRRNREWQKKRDAALAETISAVPVPSETPELQSRHDASVPEPPDVPAPGPIGTVPLSPPSPETPFFPVEDLSLDGNTRKSLAELLTMLGYCVPDEDLDVLLGPRKVPHITNRDAPIASAASTPALKSALKVTPKQGGLHHRLVQLGVAVPLDKNQPIPSESEVTPSNYSDNGKFSSFESDFMVDNDTYTRYSEETCTVLGRFRGREFCC